MEGAKKKANFAFFVLITCHLLVPRQYSLLIHQMLLGAPGTHMPSRGEWVTVFPRPFRQIAYPVVYGPDGWCSCSGFSVPRWSGCPACVAGCIRHPEMPVDFLRVPSPGVPALQWCIDAGLRDGHRTGFAVAAVVAEYLLVFSPCWQ